MKVREDYARRTGRNLLNALGQYDVPVDLAEICQRRGYILDWSALVGTDTDAVTFFHEGVYGIYLSPRLKCAPRCQFTICHELAHCELGHFRDYDLTFINSSALGNQTAWALNREANICSEEILMPREFILANYLKGFAYLQKACGVSKPALTIRLKTLDLSSQCQPPAYPSVATAQ